MNVTLKQLRAFLAVARTGSFTLAAESLFVTQSALSSLIKELENAIGARLMDRSTRRIQLSNIGSDLVPLVDKIIQDLDRVLTGVADVTALKKGLVRIAGPQLMSCTLLTEFIAAYNKEYPEIAIRLVDCGVEEVAPKVITGEVDFGVGPERDPSSDLAAKQLFELPFVVVFPPGHPLAAHSEVRWADLAAYPFISLRGHFTERIAVDLHAAILDLTLTPAHEVAFMSTALSMASSGLGVTACIPYANSLVELYKLEMRPLRDPEVKRRFFVLTRGGRSLSPAAESAMAFLFSFCNIRWPAEQSL
ncbi:LysR family transcriptional regulator [Actimicrobium antarcticum]|uniref:LysR family transcriptional regulator n=1 Tax=Actimicrobium antarcticum TaxID=1051899 RepID=A0ABP7SKT1_9BURK